MENKKLKLDFEMTIFDIVDLNKSFAAAKCLVCYTGRNRNYSTIGRQQLLDAIPSIKNIPVVGRYDSDKDDFGGHDIKVVNKKDGIDVVNATIPFGVVPESANQWFETRIVNGEEKECFFTDIVLWKRQYGYERIAQAKTISESMEINISEYVVDQDGYCIIDKFEFEALCLLGDDVTPCFENACVQMYSNEIVSDFKLQFSEMLREFKELNQPSTMEVDIDKNNGGSAMEEIKNEVVEEVTETVVEEVVEETVDETVDEVVVEEETVEETVTEETTEEVVEETTEETVEEETVEGTPEVTEEVTEETTETVVEESSEDFSVLYEELKEKYEALVEEFSAYKEEHAYANADYELLAQFKSDKEAEERKNAEDALFADYEERIGETEEFKELKKNSSEFSLEALKKECLCIVGMYSMTTEVKETKKPDSLKFSFEPKEEANDDPYGNIREKYLKR